jgi:DNA-directed RNA polymerase specialized sigma24 family protein
MEELLIPVSVFKKPKLTPFEAMVTYLKEEKNLNYREIGKLLKRDERNIWTVYNRAKKK